MWSKLWILGALMSVGSAVFADPPQRDAANGAYASSPNGSAYTPMQEKAVSLLPTILDMPLILDALSSKGDKPKTTSEHYIFSCLAPSIRFDLKREKVLTDQQFVDQFGNLAAELTDIYIAEKACLDKGIQARKIRTTSKKANL